MTRENKLFFLIFFSNVSYKITKLSIVQLSMAGGQEELFFEGICKVSVVRAFSI